MASAADLAILLRVQETGAEVLDKMHSGLTSLGTAAVAGTAVAATALIGLGVAAFKLGEEFDSAYDAIRVGTGATGDALNGLKDDFRAVAAGVPESFDQVGLAIADLNTRTGATGPALQGLAKNFLDLSRVTGEDMKTSIASVTRAFGDWGISAEDQSGAMDKLFRASQATGIGVNELSAKVVQFGAPLRAMGFSFEEAAAMLGKFEKEGVNGELVMGSLRIAMGNFAKEGVPMREGLDGIINKIQELGPGAEATSLAMKTFGARAGPDMAAAILEGRFALGELLDQVANGSETISQAADDTADGAEKWATGMNRIKLAMEPLGEVMFNLAGTALEVMAPAFETAIDAITPVIEGLAAVIQTAIDGDIREAFITLVDQVGFTGVQLQEQLGLWAEQFLAWIQVAGPPMLVAVGEATASLLDWLYATLPQIIEKLATWAAAFVDWVAPLIPPLLQQLGALLVQFGGWIIGTALPDITTKLLTWGLALVEWIAPRIGPLMAELASLLAQMVGWMVGAALSGIKNAAVSWGTGIVSSLVEGVSGLGGALSNAIMSAIRSINFTVGVLTFSGGNISINAGFISHQLASLGGDFEQRALGGPVAGGRPYVVGERGPELFVPGSSGSIIPNHQLGGGQVINFNGMTHPEAFDQLERMQRRQRILAGGMA